MALDTVADYLNHARILLQDQVEPHRYPDDDLVLALDAAILEARRLRPDIFLAYLRTSLPSYSGQPTTTAVAVDPQYRMAFVYYICGQAQLRDEENTQDARATVFLNKFLAQLLQINA